MNLVFLGSGNTATVLAKRMYAKGHAVLQVWSRNKSNAQALAKEVNAEAIESVDQVNPAADICIIAVTDDAVIQLAKQLKPGNKLVVHTAGAVNLDVLKNASTNYGVFYPLQSLRKETEPVTDIPFLIDGSSEEVKVLLTDFAKSISGIVSLANDEQRLQLHLSAVVVNNFTNHLYTLAEDYCKHHALNFQLLLPLIQETAMRLGSASASSLQTGPAKRMDVQTIQKHLQLLNGDAELQQLYQIFTDSITTYYKNKELRNS